MTDLTLAATTTELLSLLQKLSALAPEICLYDRAQPNHYRFRLNDLNHTIDLVDDKDVEPIDYAALQWVLQGAISDRGLVVDIESYRHADTQELRWADTQKLRWDAIVYSKSRMVFDGESFRCDDANPAIALLTAFIAALEAV